MMVPSTTSTELSSMSPGGRQGMPSLWGLLRYNTKSLTMNHSPVMFEEYLAHCMLKTTFVDFDKDQDTKF